MATADRVLALKLIGDVSDINKGLKGVTGKFKKMSDESRKWGKALAGGLVLDGINAIGDAIGQAFGDLKAQDRLLKQTQQVLKTTGGAAKISAKGVVDLASALEDMSGIDQEAVQGAENLLLTFTKIRGPVFKQATKAVLDMSVAMGGGPNGLKSASIQVGKALNDPIKGITALTRVGVTFDDQQKKQITHLVETGQTAKAQAIILAELQKEFGGSARAFGNSLDGQLAKVGQHIGDIAQRVVKFALPAFRRVVGIVEKITKGDFSGAGKGLNDLLFGVDKVIKKGKKGHKVVVGVEHQDGLVQQVAAIGDTVIQGLKDAIGKLGKIDLASVFSFDNLHNLLASAINALSANSGVLISIGAAALALGTVFSTAMFVTSLFTTAAGAVFALPAWAVGTTISTAVAAVGTALGLAMRTAMFVADKFASAAIGAFNAIASNKGLLNTAYSAGASFGHKITAGILSGLILADIVNMVADQLGLPSDYNYRDHAPTVSKPVYKGGQLRGGGFASGTSSASPGWHWVGEHGKELMQFRGGERVMPHRQSMAMAGGGGNTYNIHMGLVTDPVAAGRQVVLALKEYERRNGPGWRK